MPKSHSTLCLRRLFFFKSLVSFVGFDRRCARRVEGGAYLRAKSLLCTLLRERIGACRVFFGPISFRWGQRWDTERDLVERHTTFCDLNLVCALWFLAERLCGWLAGS